MTTIEQGRAKLHDKYKTILGRNHYSQAKRSYVFKKASDGKYYSDCSSSIAATYRECGYPITYGGSSLPSTVGFYNSKDLVDVPVVIKNGVIENPEILRVGDSLLFAGTDSGRSGSGYVGHVEMVAEISGSGKVTIYGHGSGTPRATEMNAYCKSRYKQKTTTKLGNKGLIKVRRHKLLSESVVSPAPSGPSLSIANCKSCNLRVGPGTKYKSVRTAKPGEIFEILTIKGWMPIEIKAGTVNWISEKYVKDGIITGGSVNVRIGPNTTYKSVTTVKKGMAVTPIDTNGWVPIICNGEIRWVSKKYVKT